MRGQSLGADSQIDLDSQLSILGVDGRSLRRKCPRYRSELWPCAIVRNDRRPDLARLRWYQSRAYRRLASATMPASMSASVFGGPATLTDPNTSSDRVGLKNRAALSRTPCGVSSTISRAPASQWWRCRIDFGSASCPLVDSVIIVLAAAISFSRSRVICKKAALTGRHRACTALPRAASRNYSLAA